MISVSRGWALGGLLVLLAGCNRGVGGTPSALDGDQAKLNAYTDGYNIVIGAFGLRQQLDAY